MNISCRRYGKILIIRDDYGVPHIYAKTKEGLGYGCGYITAQDRLWQADIYRRSAFGSLAELDLASIDSDYQTRSEGYSREELREMFDKWEPTKSNARLKEMMLAYVDGMNLYIEEALEAYANGDPSLIPVEYLPGIVTPDGLVDHLEPWTIEDSVAFMCSTARRWSESSELLYLTALAALQEAYNDTISWGIFNDHFPQNDPGAEVTIPSTGCYNPEPCYPRFNPCLLDNIGDVYKKYEEAKMGQIKLLESLGVPIKSGSNAWIVSPSKSITGNALMVGGPQTGHSIPQYYFEVGFHGAGINAVGMMAPVSTSIAIGVSEYGAWTSTAGFSDVMDIYIEVLNPENPHQYLHNGSWINMEKRTEKLYGYKKENYIERDIYRTIHGPIIGWDLDNNLSFTMKTTYYRNDLAALEGWSYFQQSKNIWDIQEACKLIQPSKNFYWIDRRGNIGYWHAGTFPIKPTTGLGGRLIDDRFPLWGTGQEEWVGLTGFDEMPRCINPEQGWLANWNNKPVANWSYGESDIIWGEGHHVKRIMDLLASKDKFSFEDMNSINMDAGYNHNSAINHLEELIAAASTSSDPDILAALPYLEAWNHHYNDFIEPQWDSPDATYDDPGLTIFNDWYIRVLEEVFEDDIPPSVYSEFRLAWRSTLIHVFDGPDSKLDLSYDYLNGENKTEVINRVLKWTIGNLTEEKGTNMSTWLTPVRQWEPIQMGALAPPIMHYMNRGTYNQIVEMPRWKWWHQFYRPPPHAVNVMPPGQSGFINYLGQYNHAYDQLNLYETWTYKPMRFRYQNIKKVEESRTILYYN
ncbi:MAG: penicillin acylase family protein [Promethearchaeota archaeon]